MKISIVIPCLNAGEWIGATLVALRNQTRAADEIIVADNGSSDETLEIARSFGGVQVIEVSRPGANRARLAGADEATGDAIMFCDADDLLAPDALEELERALERGLADGTGNVACCRWSRYELVHRAWIVAPASCRERRRGHDDLAAWLSGWYHPPCSVLWSRIAYENSGGWDRDLALNQDGDIMMRGFVAGNRLVFASGGEAFYRRLPGEGASLSSRRTTRAGLEARLHVLRRICDELAAQGRLEKYEEQLSLAFDLVANDAMPDAPDLARLARELKGDGRKKGNQVRWRESVLTGLGRRLSRVSLERGGGDPSLLPPTPSETAAAIASDSAVEPPPLMSVVIPAYNREDTILRSVGSALSQDYPALEVIVVDDGSTDRTVDLLRTLDDDRLRIVRQDNAGAGAARNRGIRESRGEYIGLLDSDDEWLPGKLRAQWNVARRAHPRVGMICTGMRTLFGHQSLRTEFPLHTGRIHHAMLARNILHGAGTSALIKREVFAVIGGFDESLQAIEDYEFWLRLTRFFDVAVVPEPLAVYYDLEPGDESDGSPRVSRAFVKNQDARRQVFERYENDMTRQRIDHLFLIGSAERELASAQGSLMNAASYALRAIKRRPLTPWTYRWLATRFGPTALQRVMRKRVV